MAESLGQTTNAKSEVTPWRWRVLIPLASLLCLGLVVLIAALGREREALYDGKTVREWLVLLDRSANARSEHDATEQKLAKIGPRIVPELDRILASRPPSSSFQRQRLKDYLIRFGLIRVDPFPWRELQARACRAAYQAAERGVDIRPLVPQLRFHFTNGTYASESPRALARAGDEGIAVLTNLVITGERRVRDEAGWGLHFVARQKPAMEALVRSANTEEYASVRANALGYLRNSKGPAEIMVPLGLGSIHSEDGYVRWQAAGLLADYTDDDRARAALEQALNDPDQRVRTRATSALKRK